MTADERQSKPVDARGLKQLEFCVRESQRLADLYGISHDLSEAIRFCDLHIEIDPTETGIAIDEVTRREHTRQALCRAALVTYARTWKSGLRTGLGKEVFASLSLNAQRLHELVKPLRDKWLAHAVNCFDDVRVHLSVCQDASGTWKVGSIGVTSRHITGFRRDWMIDFRTLLEEVLAHVTVEIRQENERVLAIAQAMPVEEVLALPPTEAMALGSRLDPTQRRKRFRG